MVSNSPATSIFSCFVESIDHVFALMTVVCRVWPHIIIEKPMEPNTQGKRLKKIDLLDQKPGVSQQHMITIAGVYLQHTTFICISKSSQKGRIRIGKCSGPLWQKLMRSWLKKHLIFILVIYLTIYQKHEDLATSVCVVLRYFRLQPSWNAMSMFKKTLLKYQISKTRYQPLPKVRAASLPHLLHPSTLSSPPPSVEMAPSLLLLQGLHPQTSPWLQQPRPRGYPADKQQTPISAWLDPKQKKKPVTPPFPAEWL